MIIGFNEEYHILLIRQFRFGTNKIELEIPAGYIEPGESPKEAAIRELKEETGYSVKNVKQIGVVDANPAIMNNKCYTFLAELSEKGDIKLDPDEIIETEFATQSQCFEYLRQGIIKNAYIVVAFFWFALYNKTI